MTSTPQVVRLVQKWFDQGGLKAVLSSEYLESSDGEPLEGLAQVRVEGKSPGRLHKELQRLDAKSCTESRDLFHPGAGVLAR